MESMETTFDKLHISQCATRCIIAYHRPQFSPDEAKCLQKCTQTILRNQNALEKFRSHSKHMPL